MKKALTWAVVLLLSGMLVTTAPAAETKSSPPQYPGAQNGTPADEATVEEGQVPQAQLELMRKREEARKRRDELMKLRQQNIKALDQGKTPVREVPQ